MPTQADLAMAALQGGASAPARNTSQADAALAALNTAQPQQRGVWDGSLTDQISDAGSAFGHHAMKGVHGLAQLIENGIAKGADMLPDNPVSRYMVKTADDDNRAMAEWERQYQANTPNSAGAYVGALGGEVAPFMLNRVSSGLNATGDWVGNKVSSMLPQWASKAAPTVAKVASGATQGGMVGAAQPVTNTGQQGTSYWQQKLADVLVGGAFGGAVPIATQAIGAGWNKAKAAITDSALLNPTRYSAKQLAAQLDGSVPDVVAKLRGAPEIVPGSLPTSAQAAADPRLVMVEKALANNSPEFKVAMTQREIENNAARLRQVGKVAGDPGQLDAMVAARNATANRNYTAAYGGLDPARLTPEVQRQITDLMKRPAMLDALQAAKTRALNLGMQVDDGTSIQGLHFAKMELDSVINQAKRSGADYRGLTSTKDKLVGVIESLSPEYAAARTTFANDSKPINAMQLGTALQEKLGAAAMNGAGDPTVGFTAYRNALASALKGSKYGIDDQSLGLLRGVQDDLQRATISNSMRTPGSDTAFNQGAGRQFLKALGVNAGGDMPIGKMATVGGAATAATGSPTTGAAVAMGVKKLADISTNRVRGALGDLMTDPKKLADALDGLTPQQRASVLKTLSGQLPGPAAAIGPEVLKYLSGGQAQPVQPGWQPALQQVQ